MPKKLWNRPGYEYNLGSRAFETDPEGQAALDDLERLFRNLDSACGNLAVDDAEFSTASGLSSVIMLLRTPLPSTRGGRRTQV